uniref:Elongation of very long chain fatty acids protein n=1 Tax=Anopheles dirus TaxID=7168 RepID=A0A182N3Y3_9DIPT
MDVRDNFTDFTLASNYIMQLAVDEYQTERNWTRLIDRYWNLVEELIGGLGGKSGPRKVCCSDPRAKHLPFMDNPLPTLGMVLTYLVWVLIIGPTYMRDRKPMQLTNTLFYYNLGQVLLSAYMFYEVDRNPCGNTTLPNIINNFVHTLMYFYYMLSAMGPRYQKYLWWKKYMTEIQIAQFVICIGHAINALLTDCAYPKFITFLLLCNASIFFVLFMNFYLENYRKQATAKAVMQDVTSSATGTAAAQELMETTTLKKQQ